MPHSLRVRLKNLQRKGELTEKDIDRIFKALELEPCDDDYQTDMDEAWKQAKREPCDDVVSRQAVLDIVCGVYEKVGFGWGESNFYKAIQELPSVRPQEQTKEEHIDVFEVANAPWIFLDNCANSGYYCSKCKKKLVKEGWSETVKKINYCPNCGCRMFEPQESEDKG